MISWSSPEARFHSTGISYVHSGYHQVGDETMDYSFFPILWTAAGERTPWLTA